VRKRTGEHNPAANAIQLMTMKVSKGLEFPLGTLSDVGHTPAKDEGDQEAVRVFYVDARRAAKRYLTLSLCLSRPAQKTAIAKRLVELKLSWRCPSKSY
jgi:superfamily I DNA/RNA helicase